MNRRVGMTLIEFLVVLAILAVLAALMVAGVQRAREAANRTACADHLHQVGLACHAYHGSQGAFPPGYKAYHSTNPLDTRPGWGWAAYLLPYVEQSNLADSITFCHPIADPVNEAARGTVVPLYLCPSDPDVPATFVLTNAAGQPVAQAAPISYAATYGIGELDEIPGTPEGVFYRNSHIRLTDITDGTGTTILIGDRAWSHAMAPWAGAVNGGLVRGGPLNFAVAHDPDATYPSPNLAIIQTNTINNRADPDGALDDFFSQHTGGVNMLFADGAVHFLSEQINHAVFLALGTRAGGEIVPTTDF